MSDLVYTRRGIYRLVTAFVARVAVIFFAQAALARTAIIIARSATLSRSVTSVAPMKRNCARPTCSVAAAATMSYDYDAQVVWIEDLHHEPHPMIHDLCAQHADRSTPPSGWELRDERAPRGIYALHAS